MVMRWEKGGENDIRRVWKKSSARNEGEKQVAEKGKLKDEKLNQ